MTNCFLLCLLLVIAASCENKQNLLASKPLIDNRLTILKLGLPSLQDGMAWNTVAEKYGFSIKQIGCTIPKELWSSFHKHNDSVNAVLSKRFGKKWRLKFSVEVDSMRVIQEDILRTIADTFHMSVNGDDIYQLVKEMSIRIHPTWDSNIYQVVLHRYLQSNKVGDSTMYYRILINTKNGAVVLI